ncbi:hypothetical protein ACFXTI_014187 [Malus domestica]
MTIGELQSSTLFHVIDARTSYSLLLGRSWIHENEPFTEAESHFVFAKFYMDEDLVPEAFPKEIKSIGKAAPKKHEWQAMPKKQEWEDGPSSNKDDDELGKPTTTKGNVTPSKGPNTLVFQYILMLRRKNRQSPFENGTSKTDTQLHKDNVKLLKTNAVLPLT